MYETYWQLDTKPFENTSDSRFYYPSESHQGALLKLRYAIESRRGAALLSGASGLGKTLLVNALLRQLPESYSPVVRLVFPQMPPDQLLAYLADELTGERNPQTPTVQQSVQRIEHFLAHNVQARRHAVIVIDEAHLLEDLHSLETVRLLLNFELSTQAPLTLLLVGQPSLLPTLDRTPELDERLAVKCLIRRFTLDETVSYVNHRLLAAGAKRPIFEDEAIEALHGATHGVARQINRLGDLALLIGFAEERPILGAEQIHSVAEELVTVSPE
ncbi:MAG: AAA family ATPase [Planctomycetales bacterium]|nr:AAA family ATPase [Planctomycetales bacterium]MCA9210310.1 AAA family ATPase [Planctomycetales bacterium]MCA9223532.1 AAA family ATPase [Planctomycetales bacterium]MCA9224836.1 AAA family ATPase [Planctomycetales bacterium]